jgi:REP element-mobilizing transposase RayT
MPRKPRVEDAGLHHIINRGVARGDIFLKNKDFEEFLQNIQIAKDRYDFIVHSLCLMSNHYHLLLETKHDNLALIMRQINSKYAQYFNREYNRIGPLWQGRFKSWFVYSDEYLYILLRYIEQNPIKASITKSIGAYPWAASSLISSDDPLTLFDKSLLFDKDLFLLLDKKLSDDDYESFDKFQKTTYKEENKKVVRLKQKSLDEHFANYLDLKERNKTVFEAIKDGYKQSEIGRYLGLSSAGVSYIVNTKC